MLNRNQFKSDKRHNAHSHPCSCCSMSRRSFLGAAAACTAALTTGCASLESLHTAPKSHEEIDIASFRPRPKVRVMSVVAREKPPYWLGWPGTAYNVEGERVRYTRAIADAGRRVEIEILEERQPLEERPRNPMPC
ncbi:MAG: twin-arginine translocation signal domain-containing protein [Planctomycetota bacterium]